MGISTRSNLHVVFPAGGIYLVLGSWAVFLGGDEGPCIPEDTWEGMSKKPIKRGKNS